MSAVMRDGLPARPLTRGGRLALAIACAVVITAAVAYNAWLVGADNWFYADDWGWLGRARFAPFDWLADLWPRHIYNSRPLGEAVITGMFHVVGWNAVAFHVLWLAGHVLNAVLLVLFLRPHVGPVRASVAGLLAACWHVTLGAVGWIGAGFDLFATTWCLLALLCHRRAMSGGAGLRWPLLTALAYLAGLRTKEFAIALVALLATYELAFATDAWRLRLRRLAPSLVVFVVFAARYAMLATTTPPAPAGDPYAANLQPGSIVATFAHYLQWMFYAEAQPPGLLLGLFAALCVLAALTRNRLLAWSLLACVALISPVLLMPAQQSTLYLYAPHFMLAAALVALWPSSRIATAAIVLAAAALVAWPWYTGGAHNERNFQLGSGRYARGLFDDYLRMPPASAEFIRVDRAYFSPFGYGARSVADAGVAKQQLNAVNILRNDRSIPVVVDESMDALLPAFCRHAPPAARLLDEQAGHLVDRTGWARGRCADAPAAVTQPR